MKFVEIYGERINLLTVKTYGINNDPIRFGSAQTVVTFIDGTKTGYNISPKELDSIIEEALKDNK